MIRKTLIKKSTGDWAVYQHEEMFTTDTPVLLPISARIETIKQYINQFSKRAEKLNLDDYDVVEVKIERV